MNKDIHLIFEAYKSKRLLKEEGGSDFASQLEQARAGEYTAYIDFLVKNKQNPELAEILSKGQGNSDSLKFTPTSVAVTTCIPTQNEIDVEKSLKFPLSIVPTSISDYIKNPKDVMIGKPPTPIVIYNHQGKNYIMDGHHRWSQVYAINPQATMKAIDLTPGQNIDPVEMLKTIQTAILAVNKNIPVEGAPGDNLLTKDLPGLKTWIMSTATDAAVENAKQVEYASDKEQLADRIIKNVVEMRKTSQPIAGASKRDYMPQTDKPEGDSALKKIMQQSPAGKLNILHPLAPAKAASTA